MLYFFIIIAQAIIFGVATKVVITNKGYTENWFWWGFFFGLIALIVACAKPQNIDYSSFIRQPSQSTPTNHQSSYGNNLSDTTNKVHNDQLLANGGWKCSCGRMHASYISTCSCGRSKHEVQAAEHKKKQEEAKIQEELKKQEASQKQTKTMDESTKLAAIKEYKELLDMGVITQDEFDAKKKQLLGL